MSLPNMEYNDEVQKLMGSGVDSHEIRDIASQVSWFLESHPELNGEMRAKYLEGLRFFYQSLKSKARTPVGGAEVARAYHLFYSGVRGVFPSMTKYALEERLVLQAEVGLSLFNAGVVEGMIIGTRRANGTDSRIFSMQKGTNPKTGAHPAPQVAPAVQTAAAS